MRNFLAGLGAGTVAIVIFILVLCCCCMCFSMYAVISNGGLGVGPNDNTPYNIPAPGTGNPTTGNYGETNFKGEFITASLPKGWKLVEFNDGSNIPQDMLFEGKFSGFTGLKLTSPDGKTIVDMYAVNGIGGNDHCREVFVMSDTAESYVEERMSVADSELEPGEKITRTSVAGPYQDFNLFGDKGRLSAAGDAYWADDQSSNDKVFNPLCDGLRDFKSPEGLEYQIVSGGNGSFDGGSYYIDINAKALNAVERDQLIRILNSMNSN